jgi:hypothetical protein
VIELPQVPERLSSNKTLLILPGQDRTAKHHRCQRPEERVSKPVRRLFKLPPPSGGGQVAASSAALAKTIKAKIRQASPERAKAKRKYFLNVGLEVRSRQLIAVHDLKGRGNLNSQRRRSR